MGHSFFIQSNDDLYRPMLLRQLSVCLVLLSCISCRCYKPAQAFSPCGKAYLPVFVLPESDQRNGIEKVYFCEQIRATENVWELSVVYADEDQPFFLFDIAYDLFRDLRFHRKKDIETIYLHTNTENSALLSVDFGDAYSGSQHFYTGIVRHFHRVVPQAMIQLDSGRPVLFINTWNHLFSETDTNPTLAKNRIYNYSCCSGSRSDAEPQHPSR
jgi:hypothetical protein